MNAQQAIERRIYALHQRVIEIFLDDPQKVRMIAQKNMANWRSRDAGNTAYYAQWKTIMTWNDKRIIDVLNNNSDFAILARSNSPFAGLISAKERWDIINMEKKYYQQFSPRPDDETQ